MTSYEREWIDTVDAQVWNCKVLSTHYCSCCTLFLWYRNHPTHNPDSILDYHLHESEQIDHSDSLQA